MNKDVGQQLTRFFYLKHPLSVGHGLGLFAFSLGIGNADILVLPPFLDSLAIVIL